MLIQQPIKDGDIIAIKTTAGEELLATLKTMNDNSFIVSKPANVAVAEGQNDQVAVDFHPSMFSMDINNTVEIIKASVFMVTKPRKELLDAYIQSTSGIKKAPAGILDGQGS